MPETCLYFGNVMHARLRPFRHRFVYGVFSMLVDLDELRLNLLKRFAVRCGALYWCCCCPVQIPVRTLPERTLASGRLFL